MLREPWRDLVPHNMCLGIAVQQQYRRPLSPTDEVDKCTRCLDLGSAKTFEHVATPSQTVGAGRAGHDKGLCMKRPLSILESVQKTLESVAYFRPNSSSFPTIELMRGRSL